MEFLSDTAVVADLFLQKQITSASLRDCDFIRSLDLADSFTPVLTFCFCPLLLLLLERDTPTLAVQGSHHSVVFSVSSL